MDDTIDQMHQTAKATKQIMRGIMRAVGAIMRSPNMDRRF